LTNDNGYLTAEGKILSFDADGGNAWLAQIAIGIGQGGSPVYTENGQVVGVLQGAISEVPGTSYMVPSALAEQVLPPSRLNDLIAALIDKGVTAGPETLNKIVTIENVIKKVRQKITWEAKVINDVLTISYDMFLPDSPPPDKISVLITAVGEGAGGEQEIMPSFRKVVPRPGRSKSSGGFEVSGISNDLFGPMEERSVKVLHLLNLLIEPSIKEGDQFTKLESKSITVQYDLKGQ
jgi:hypothetical protein